MTQLHFGESTRSPVEPPDVLATTQAGHKRNGPRQNRDITHPRLRFHAERGIHATVSRCCAHPTLVGYQTDNETKHRSNFGSAVEAGFVEHLKEPLGNPTWPVNRKNGVNAQGRRVAYSLNYADSPLLERLVGTEQTLTLPGWGVQMIEENTK